MTHVGALIRATMEPGLIATYQQPLSASGGNALRLGVEETLCCFSPHCCLLPCPWRVRS